MADNGEDEDEASNAASWWNYIYDSAKQKIAETNEFVMRDMKEFTQTVKTDTSKFVAETASTMKEQLNLKVNLDEASQATKVVTKSISNFLGTVVQQVAPQLPENDENQDSVMYLGTSSGVKVMTPAEARLFTLQTSPGIYCTEPDNSIEFDLWLKTFDLNIRKEELSLLMLDSREVRCLYTKLVPEAVSHVDFWTRYFYKKHLLDQAEDRRVSIMQRAESKTTELTWDDEDDSELGEFSNSQQADKTATEKSNASNQSPVSNETLDQTNRLDAPAVIDISRDVSVTNSEKLSLPDDEINADINLKSNPTEQVTSIKDDIHQLQQIPSAASDITGGSEGELCNQVMSCEKGDVAIDVKPSMKDKADDVTLSTNVTTKDKNETIAVSSASSEVKVDVVPPKESSSGGSSDWEKEFDLEMTEEEINEALLEDETDFQGEIEGWDDWE